MTRGSWFHNLGAATLNDLFCTKADLVNGTFSNMRSPERKFLDGVCT